MAGRRRRFIRDFHPCLAPDERYKDGRLCPGSAVFQDTQLCEWHDSQRTCEIEGCDHKHFSGGKCKYHYYAARKRTNNIQAQMSTSFSEAEIAVLKQMVAERA